MHDGNPNRPMYHENPNPIIADLQERLLKAERELQAVLELATHFQDDYTIKLSVIAAFRQWRGGHLTSEQFLARLRSDDLAPVLHYEKAPPMVGLAILGRHRNR
jgi:hypothetical protein